MSYHAAIRTAVVAWLKAGGVDKVFSSPPAEIAPPLVVVGKIIADEPLCKNEPGGFYAIGIEIWSQTNSPLKGEVLADLVSRLLNDLMRLPCAAASLTGVQFVQEDQSFHPDAPGGPILARPMTFRLLAQPHD